MPQLQCMPMMQPPQQMPPMDPNAMMQYASGMSPEELAQLVEMIQRQAPQRMPDMPPPQELRGINRLGPPPQELRGINRLGPPPQELRGINRSGPPPQELRGINRPGRDRMPEISPMQGQGYNPSNRSFTTDNTPDTQSDTGAQYNAKRY